MVNGKEEVTIEAFSLLKQIEELECKERLKQILRTNKSSKMNFSDILSAPIKEKLAIEKEEEVVFNPKQVFEPGISKRDCEIA